MARLIWTEPALNDLDGIADYIALDNPDAACGLVERVFKSVGRLEHFPLSGKRPPELPRSAYREVMIAPCRIFYRAEGDAVFVLYVMRAERLLHRFLLEAQTKKE